MNQTNILDDGFELIKADARQFAIHYSTYRENVFYRQSWEQRLSIFNEDSSCYWIKLKNRRIGGVCIEPNFLSSFFIEPPFVDYNRVLIQLKKLLIQCSDPSKQIRVHGILPYQNEYFLRLGFLPIESRRVMIRPTESFDLEYVGENFEIVTPTSEYIEEMAHILFEAYSGKDSIGFPRENKIEEHRVGLNYYFENSKEEVVKSSSSVVLDKANHKIVAICLVSLWEDLPLVSNIAVLPQYRNKQFATYLLKKALTVLNKEYDVLRLFVTLGNSAESLYYNLGFYPGLEQTKFYLPPKGKQKTKLSIEESCF